MSLPATILILEAADVDYVREALFRDFVQARAATRTNAVAVVICSPVADNTYDTFCTSLVCIIIFFASIYFVMSNLVAGNFSTIFPYAAGPRDCGKRGGRL